MTTWSAQAYFKIKMILNCYVKNTTIVCFRQEHTAYTQNVLHEIEPCCDFTCDNWVISNYLKMERKTWLSRNTVIWKQ